MTDNAKAVIAYLHLGGKVEAEYHTRNSFTVFPQRDRHAKHDPCCDFETTVTREDLGIIIEKFGYVYDRFDVGCINLSDYARQVWNNTHA